MCCNVSSFFSSAWGLWGMDMTERITRAGQYSSIFLCRLIPTADGSLGEMADYWIHDDHDQDTFECPVYCVRVTLSCEYPWHVLRLGSPPTPTKKVMPCQIQAIFKVQHIRLEIRHKEQSYVGELGPTLLQWSFKHLLSSAFTKPTCAIFIYFSKLSSITWRKNCKHPSILFLSPLQPNSLGSAGAKPGWQGTPWTNCKGIMTKKQPYMCKNTWVENS